MPKRSIRGSAAGPITAEAAETSMREIELGFEGAQVHPRLLELRTTARRARGASQIFAGEI